MRESANVNAVVVLVLVQVDAQEAGCRSAQLLRLDPSETTISIIQTTRIQGSLGKLI